MKQGSLAHRKMLSKSLKASWAKLKGSQRVARTSKIFGKGCKARCTACSEWFGKQSRSQKVCPACRLRENLSRPICQCGCNARLPAFATGQKRVIAGHQWRVQLANKALWEARSKKISQYGKKLWEQYTPQERETRGRAVRRGQARMSKLERDLWIRRRFLSANLKPNRVESQLQEILAVSFPNEFHINVKGETVIGGKVPDFVNCNGKKVVVELFGDYWHGEEFTGENNSVHEYRRAAVFAKWGFKMVAIWERELKDPVAVVEKVAAALQEKS